MKLAPSFPAAVVNWGYYNTSAWLQSLYFSCIPRSLRAHFVFGVFCFCFSLMFSHHHGAGCCCHAGILDSQVIAETKKHYVGENSQLCPSYSRGSHQIRFCLKLVRSWAIRSNFPQIARTSKHCNEQHSDTQVPAINVVFKTMRSSAQFVSLLDRNPYIFLSFLIISSSKCFWCI